VFIPPTPTTRQLAESGLPASTRRVESRRADGQESLYYISYKLQVESNKGEVKICSALATCNFLLATGRRRPPFSVHLLLALAKFANIGL